LFGVVVVFEMDQMGLEITSRVC